MKTGLRVKILDRGTGIVYASMADVSRAIGCRLDSVRQAFNVRKADEILFKGHRLMRVTPEMEQPDQKPKKEAETPVVERAQAQTINPTISAILERYTEEELEWLAKGQGLTDKNLRYQKPHLEGKHFRIGVISDGHLGSKYSPIEWHLSAFKEFEKAKCNCVLHCGDLVDGLKRNRADTQIYELSHIGYKAQRDLAVDVFGQCNLPIYAISGNHDGFFNDCGANIVEDIANRLDNMTYLGDGTADLTFDGAIVRLHHGGDGNSYALSYRLQKLIESYSGGKKPNILLAGHVHKYCHIFERNIQAVSVPTLQMQTSWMQQKKLAAHTGFLIIDFDVFEEQVVNFQIKMYPYYE